MEAVSLRDANLELNQREFELGSLALASTPSLVTLGTHNACNAKCIFCLEGRYQRFSVKLYKEFFEMKLGHFIRNARRVTFTGFGEILWVPEIEEFLDYLNQTLPDVEKIFTTNGTPLRPAVQERLLQGKYVLQISLHASNPSLHEELTGLVGEFDSILFRIRELAALRRRRGGAYPRIQLVNVLTTRNIDDLPDFLELAYSLGVPDVRCQYVTMFTPEHIPLSCFFEQERANRVLEAAGGLVLLLRAAAALERTPREFRVSLPPRFGPKPRESSGGMCPEPWQHLYVELQGSVLPCCYWGSHIGNLSRGDGVDSLWNGPFHQALRKGMASGKPHPWCAACVRYQGYNVDNILCHITNRPEAQKVILEEMSRKGAHYAGNGHG